jgi:hypothetical protein
MYEEIDMAIESALETDSDDSDDSEGSDSDDARSVFSDVSEDATVVDASLADDRAKDFPSPTAAPAPAIAISTATDGSADDISKRVSVPPVGFDLSIAVNRYIWEQRWRRKADGLVPSVSQEEMCMRKAEAEAAVERARQAEARQKRSIGLRLRRSLQSLKALIS